jgi:hypothetical protein
MSQSGLELIEAKTVKDVVSRAALSDEALGLVRGDLAPGPFLDLLLKHGHHLDAIRFLAQALVKRAAVWWALQCVTETSGTELPAAKAKALEAARAWVLDPSDDNRRACWPAAEAAEIGSPAGCTAMAAFFSGGSLSLPNLPAVPPGEEFTGRMAAGALMLAAVMKEPEKAPEKYAAFLRTGLEIADGKNLWPTPPRVPPAARPPMKKR